MNSNSESQRSRTPADAWLHNARLPGSLLAVGLAVLSARAHSRYYIAYSFAAAFVVWASTRPPKIRYAYVAVIVAMLWAIRLFSHEPSPALADSAAEQMFYLTAGFIGAGSLIVFALFGPADSTAIDPVDMTAAFAIASFGLVADRWFRYMTAHPLPSLDRTLFAFDQTLGFQASFFTGQAFTRWPAIAFLSVAAYRMLPITIAWVFVSLPRRSARIAYAMAIASAATIGYLAYRVCPAAGPTYAFPEMFPANVPAISPGWIHPVEMNSSLLNAFPSLHATWALLTLAWSRTMSRRPRIAVAFAVSLTLLATLGLGEHYLIDLAVAVPFAVTFEALCTIQASSWKRHALTAAASSVVFLVWVVMVRSGAALELHPATARVLAATTVFVPLLLRQLTRRSP